MADVTINVKFSPAIKNIADAFKNPELFKTVQDEIYKFAFNIERYAKQLTPVDSGRLRASIGTSLFIGQLGAVVSTNTEYAVYVHDGTRYMRSRPFMEEGAKFAQDRIAGAVGARIDEKFREKFKSLK